MAAMPPVASRERYCSGVAGLEDLTLIIPTLNRHQSVARAISYWSDRGPRVLILDGTEDPIEDSILQSMGSNVRYMHGEREITTRLEMVESAVSTDFACLHGDDELHLPSALDASVQLLIEQPQVASCMGWALGFEASDDGDIWASECYPALRGYQIDSEHPMSRVRQHLIPYVVPAQVYAVARTTLLIRALRTSLSNPHRSFFAQSELEYEISMAAQGNFFSIPQLHWLRRMEPSELRGTNVDTNPEMSFTSFWSDPLRAIEREYFVNNLARNLAEIAGDSEADAKSELLNILDAHHHMRKAGEQAALRGVLRRTLRPYLSPLWPLARRARARVNVFREMTKPPTLIAEAEGLRRTGMTFDEDELLEAIAYLSPHDAAGSP